MFSISNTSTSTSTASKAVGNAPPLVYLRRPHHLRFKALASSAFVEPRLTADLVPTRSIIGVCRGIAAPRHVACAAGKKGKDPSTRLERVLARIDALNAKDPRKIKVDGEDVPYELAYSRWLSEWVQKLTADSPAGASEELLICARGQHVQRWTSPRTSYPEGRTSYFRWREDLKKFHSAVVMGIMAEEECDEDSCEKVISMMLKKELKEHEENQIIEDALCLVFLERQFAEMRSKESEDKVVDIVRKTWAKMGPKGHAAALALAPSLCAEEQALIGKALAPPPPPPPERQTIRDLTRGLK